MKKQNSSIYLPAFLIVFVHACERMLSSIGNNKREEIIIVSAILIPIFMVIELRKRMNVSKTFIISFILVMIISLTQNIFLYGVSALIALILLVIEILKAIGRKDIKYVLLCVLTALLMIETPDIAMFAKYGWAIVLFLYVILMLNASTEKLVVYAVITLFITIISPFTAIIFVLMIEEVLVCIKAQNILSFGLAILGIIISYVIIFLIFQNNITAILFMIILWRLKKYSIG